MGGVNVRVPIINALGKRKPGERVTRAELVRETGFTEKQVRAAMRNIMIEKQVPLTLVYQGNVWEIDQPASAPVTAATQATPADEFHARIVERAGGHLVVEDNDGWLYIVKRLGISEAG